MAPYYLAIILILILVILYLIHQLERGNRQEKAYRISLENNQRLLDKNAAQVSIFMKSLPHIQRMVAEAHMEEEWKATALEELRAMVRAEGASYWRYIENSQTLSQDVFRGSEPDLKNVVNKISIREGNLGQAARQKTMVMANEKSENGDPYCTLILPLVVGENLWGVFRFVRSGVEPFSARECDLSQVFVRQLGLVHENRDMIKNREKFYLELVQTLADTLDSRDASREGQTRRARRLARGVAEQMNLPEEFIYYLEFAALMHDIGNIAIDESLLKKPGKLTKEEFEIIKKHPELGHKILKPVTMLAPVAPMVLYHQEWYNGQGYPEGLIGEEIPLGARIVAVLDAWGAMTSDRPWRRALTPIGAMKEIRKNAGIQFDPKVVDAFQLTLEKEGTLSDKARV